MTHVSLCPKDGRITVRGALPGGGRQLAVTIAAGERLVFAAWGRAADSPGGPKKFHPYPGEVLGEDFLDRREHAILATGLVALAEECVGRVSDEQTVKLAIEVVRGIVACAGGAPIELPESF